jgi:hypothetical protein
MLYGEIIAVCSEIHTKHTNTLCGQNAELLNVKLAVRIVTTGIWRIYKTPILKLCNQPSRRSETKLIIGNMLPGQSYRTVTKWRIHNSREKLQTLRENTASV